MLILNLRSCPALHINCIKRANYLQERVAWIPERKTRAMRLARPERWRAARSADDHGHALDGVHAVTAVVPALVAVRGLRPPRGVGGSGAELVLAGLPGVPLAGPRSPGVGTEGFAELGIFPRVPAVRGELHPLDGPEAGPRAALHEDLAGSRVPLAREEVGDSRRDHQGARSLAGHRRTGVVLGLLVAVLDPLLDAFERLGYGCDLLQPLHRGHPVPVRHD